jgi:MFS family permease
LADKQGAAIVSRRDTQLGLVITEWRTAWRPGIAALFAGALGYSIYPGVSSLFVEPLQAQFGWSRGEIALVHSFSILIAFTAPFYGRLADRHGVRPVLLTTLALTGLGYGLLALMQGSLDYYYAIFFLFNVVGMGTTGVCVTRIITGAFDRTRGTALAIGRAGLAVSTAILSQALFPVITRYGTAGGFLMLGALILLIALPLVWLWVPSRASDIAAGRVGAHGADSWFSLLATPKIRILSAAALFNYVPVMAILSQLKPIAVAKGLDPGMAVHAVSVMAIAAACGALLSGVLVDRFWAPAVAAVLNLAPAAGCLFLLQAEVPPELFFAAIVLVGLGQGAEIDIVAYMTARYFALRNYASIYGITVLGIGLGTSAGATLIGMAYDRFGHYDYAIMATSVSFVLAAGFYLAMGRYPAHQPR